MSIVGRVMLTLGAALIVAPLVALVFVLFVRSDSLPDLVEKLSGSVGVVLGAGLVLVIAGAYFFIGRPPSKIGLPGGSVVEASDYYARTEGIEPKVLAEEVKEDREVYAEAAPVPGLDAPKFNVLRDKLSFRIIPIADRMTPMYVLDSAYRIVHWNRAFGLAFDSTMEGRRGQSVLEWTYYLDNYEAVLDHGRKEFSDPNNLPLIDVEPIEYTSARYNKINATKRAYRLPDDDGSCVGWLIILELKFLENEQGIMFQHDLIRALGVDQLWSEYSLSYDRVLGGTAVYNQLLQDILGETGNLYEIPERIKVIDLGAGTGNLTLKLVQPDKERVVWALENNDAMFNLLRSKCAPFLREDDSQPGIIAIKQDISSLLGLEDEYFDYAIMNNVLYTLADPSLCLAEVYRVLKTGGEIRISGPKKGTEIDVLFDRIKKDLEASGDFGRVESDYWHVEEINKRRLSDMLYKYDVADVEALLLGVGFAETTYKTDTAYAGQAMIVCARK